MGRAVLFIAGGIWQLPFVDYLKGRGHFVAVVNPIATHTTSRADLHIKADVNDLEAIERHIPKLNPVFITTDQSDVSTFTAAVLSEKYNLPGNSPSVIDKLSNKYSIYQFATSLGIRVPKTELIHCVEDIKSFVVRHGLPIIIKPVDATMSRGFRKIQSMSEIDTCLYEESKKFSKKGQIVAQVFIDGLMVTLEGVCSGGRHSTIATSAKESYFCPGINTGCRYPSNVPTISQVIAINDFYVESAGMQLGLTHSEFIINKDGFWFIEIGGRGGGAGIADKIVPWVSGINPYEVLYNSLMGKIMDVKSLTPTNRPALLKYYREDEVRDCNPHVESIIKNMPGVASFHHNFIGRQYVKDTYDQRHSMGIYLADTNHQLDELVNNVNHILNPSLMA